MAVANSRLAALHDAAALLEVLEGDDRPTFILEHDVREPRIVFRNTSLDQLLSHVTLRSAFDDWAVAIASESLLNSPCFYAGRDWSSKSFRDAWTIVHCSPSTQQSPSTISTNFEIPIQSTSRSASISSQGRRNSSRFVAPITPLTPLSPSMPNSTKKLADWTLSDATSPWFHFVKHFSWSDTPFGAIDTWSLELRRSTAKIMNSPDPRILIFGDQKAMIYNEAFAAVIGKHHPQCLGVPIADVQDDMIFKILWDMSLTAYDGRAARRTRQELLLERNGSMEQTFWNVFLSPLPGLDGYCDSVVGEFTDVTDLVVQDQRESQGLDILDSVSKVEALPELWSQFLGALDNNAPDISYAMIYTAFDHSSFVRSEGLPTPDYTPHHDTLQSVTSYFVKQYQLAGSLRIPESVLEPIIDLSSAESSGTPGLANAFREAFETKEVMILSDEALPHELSVRVADSGIVRCASIFPIANLDGKPLAVVVLGLDPRRPFNEQMSRFVHCMHEAICKQAILITLPQDQQQFQRKYEETTMALSTELRLSILKAKKKEEKFLRIAKSAPLGMFLYSPKERTIQVNDAYLKITGTTKQDLDKTAALELPWLQTVSEEYMDLAIKEWQHLMTEKTPSAIEYKIRDLSDSPTSRWVSATSFPDLDEHGEVYLIHGWLVDISDRLAKDALLAQRLEDALETKTATEHFLDMVSHEMRNPLSAIFQCSDEILDTIKTHKNQPGMPLMTTAQLKSLEDAAHTIALCAQHQNGIFSDILTVSKLDSQLLTIMPEKIRPVDIVQRALKMYGQEAKRSDIITSIDVQDTYTKHIAEFVMADPNRLLQIIINLLTNAINHTRSCRERSIVISLGASTTEPDDASNQITFMPPTPRRSSSPLTPATEQDQFSAAFLKSCSGQDVYLHVAVQDTGCGLSESEMRLLFKRFSQPKTYGQYSGSGLGLFLSKELIELQAGRIGVTSTEGLGTTFSFYIKCRKPIEESTSAPMVTPKSPRVKGHRPRMSRTEAFNDRNLEFTRQPSPVRGLHVLVVEDNPLNQRLVAKQLRNQGCTVYTADHGLDALEFLSKTNITSSSTSGTKLDIVLLDIEMPVMDGLTCIRKIRDLEQEGFYSRRVPVIAVTANARDEQMREALEAGMDAVVTKPFRIPELLVRMSEVVSSQNSEVDQRL